MKSNVKIAPKSNVTTPVAVSEIAEELPADTAGTEKKYTETVLSADDFDTFLATEEELRTMPVMRYRVEISPKGNTFLSTRHNGVRIEVYEADGYAAFPDGVVVGASIQARVSYKKNDGVKDKVKADDGRRFITVFATGCEVID